MHRAVRERPSLLHRRPGFETRICFFDVNVPPVNSHFFQFHFGAGTLPCSEQGSVPAPKQQLAKTISLWSRDPSLLRAGKGPCSKTATERTVGLKPPIWHRPSPDPIHFTIFISDSTSIFPSSSAPLPARPLFLQEPSIAHHATNSKSDPTHPKQDKKTQRQDAVCI